MLLAALLAAATPTWDEELRASITAREAAYRAYDACMMLNVVTLSDAHPTEPAATIVKASEHRCLTEWIALDLAIGRFAIWAHQDGEKLSAEWKDNAYAKYLSLVLEARGSATGD